MDALPVSRRRLDGEPFVEVFRGETLESIHRVAACAVDRNGSVILALGTIDVPVFLRSTAKPFIAAAVVREGIVERFGLEPREIAVIAASHDGELFHVEAVRSILRKIGLNEDALQCGAHPPYNADAAQALVCAGLPFTAIHNNCSGKHAGILALCKILGADTATYLSPENPAQRCILDFCARLCGRRVEDLPLAVDGCGIPVFATTLQSAALAFARFATLEGLETRDAQALHVVRDAIVDYPEYVAGTGAFDTILIRTAGGGIVAKSGAEAVHGTAAIASGTGIVLKVVDGGSRACAPAALSVLHGLGIIDSSMLDELQSFAEPVLYNRAGRAVGSIAALSRTMDR